MTLEGNLRELALAEVCQLLSHTRKSGELHISAPLSGLTAAIAFQQGAITGASIFGHSLVAIGAAPVRLQDAQQAVESTTFELLGWTEGTFYFEPAADRERTRKTPVRLNTEVILMESDRRTTAWQRLSDRVPHMRVVPAFADVEPRQLPLLNLAPSQWELLTSVDGQRDLPAIASSLGRDLLEVAEVVHGLLGTGLLRLVDAVPVARAHATPPSNVVQDLDALPNLWFDAPGDAGGVTLSHLRQLGDEAARAGNLAEALEHWSAVIACELPGDDATHCREVADLTERLLTKLGVSVVS